MPCSLFLTASLVLARGHASRTMIDGARYEWRCRRPPFPRESSGILWLYLLPVRWLALGQAETRGEDCGVRGKIGGTGAVQNFCDADACANAAGGERSFERSASRRMNWPTLRATEYAIVPPVFVVAPSHISGSRWESHLAKCRQRSEAFPMIVHEAILPLGR